MGIEASDSDAEEEEEEGVQGKFEFGIKPWVRKIHAGVVRFAKG